MSGPRTVGPANFVTPAPGGPRTAPREPGEGHRAAGHRPVLVVPGPGPRDEHTPGAGASPSRLPSPAATVSWPTGTARSDCRPEVCDRTTLRWTGARARRPRVPAPAGTGAPAVSIFVSASA